VKIGIGVNKKIITGKKKDADRSGIGPRITRIVHSLSIAQSKTLNCPLLEIALSAMVMIGIIELISSIRTMIDGLMGRLGGELQFTIGWGADSVCMIGLVTVSATFPGTKKKLRRWLMHEFPMSSYFAEMPILIEWSQGRIVVNQ